MNEPDYTSAAGTTGFGGGTTAFLHFGNLTGTVEANPHNLVHVMVGGVGPNAGYMSDPDLAALDPIFWVHHCNIDRLWAAWLTVPTNRMENGPTWRAGPSPRQFAMPDKDGSNLVVFTPAQTIPGGSLAPVYDDLTKGTGVPTVVASVSTRTAMPAGVQPAPAPATLFGSNTEVVEVGASPATTTVHLATRRAQAVAAAGVVRERVFLNLENVRGAAPSGVLSVSVTAPSRGTVPSSAPAVEDTIALFGLAKASASDAGHGGNGLSFAIDITGLANTVAADDLDRLEVQIRQPGEAGDSPITVDRVSVFRQPVR